MAVIGEKRPKFIEEVTERIEKRGKGGPQARKERAGIERFA
ncbi:hypothetical protein [Candidatus Methylacidithermus pantelleriae]|nr:hypothetical protein [Candidatus Methylacidithermus pantelleriae]